MSKVENIQRVLQSKGIKAYVVIIKKEEIKC
ncbi:Uncharacterised protein [Staphylococcus simulans]|nr:Uncharacterised protein [Staphylococcus simulans]